MAGAAVPVHATGELDELKIAAAEDLRAYEGGPIKTALVRRRRVTRHRTGDDITFMPLAHIWANLLVL